MELLFYDVVLAGEVGEEFPVESWYYEEGR
jgi:hypothetical protein